MAKFKASSGDVDQAEALLRAHDGLEHIRVRARADVLTLESGPAASPIPHARLRRVSTQYFQLEMPTHAGKWQSTPFRGLLGAVLADALDQFAWAFTPIGEDPGKD